jgi:hypothetical protein
MRYRDNMPVDASLHLWKKGSEYGLKSDSFSEPERKEIKNFFTFNAILTEKAFLADGF